MLLLLEELPRGPWPTQDYFRFRGASAKLPHTFRKILLKCFYGNNKKNTFKQLKKELPHVLPQTFRHFPPNGELTLVFRLPHTFRGTSAVLPRLWRLQIAASIQLPLSFRWASAVLPPLWWMSISFLASAKASAKLPPYFRPYGELTFFPVLPPSFRIPSALLPPLWGAWTHGPSLLK